MMRFSLVLVVGLINFGLGFAAAVYAGRGPWSRSLRHHGQGTTRGSSPRDPSSLEPASIQAGNSTSVEQIAAELEQAEQRFRSLLGADSGENCPTIPIAELVSAVKQTSDQIAKLTPRPEKSSDASLPVIQGLDLLRSLLKSASEELKQATNEPGPNSPGPSTDPVHLATSLLTACQEARGAFTALLFADQPA